MGSTPARHSHSIKPGNQWGTATFWLGERPVRGETILATAAENIAHTLAHTRKHRHHALPPCCSEQLLWLCLLRLLFSHSPTSKGPVSVHRSHCLPGHSAHTPLLKERRSNIPLSAPFNTHLIKSKLWSAGKWHRLCSWNALLWFLTESWLYYCRLWPNMQLGKEVWCGRQARCWTVVSFASYKNFKGTAPG